ncbi:hypothetical protein CKA32_000431 [Geitlerinema sp. FC II]|nr:hypothetical protein CKA32_000431 [Geitlerinema sp. FC II]
MLRDLQLLFNEIGFTKSLPHISPGLTWGDSNRFTKKSIKL